MIIDICHYFLIFIIYSFIGWMMEVILTLVKSGKFVDRGFLIGPYCPIYGWGSLLITNLLKDYIDNFIVVFILAMVICMILEYITSYLMEKLFKARWWDYSDQKYNINGRICLETAVPFGLGALVVMYVVHPFILEVLSEFSITGTYILSGIIFVLFLLDNIVSFNIISKFKDIEVKAHKDNTEEITMKIKEYLLTHSKFTKRLVDAFPNVEARINGLKEKQKNLEKTIRIKQKNLEKAIKKKQKELKKLVKLSKKNDKKL